MAMGKGVWFAVGAAGAAIGVYWFMRKIQVPNAYALGQANPTTAYTALTSTQLAQLNQQPPLASPPAPSTQLASITNQYASQYGITTPGATPTGGATAGFRR